MGKTITFPPRDPCACGGPPLRPATRAELNADLVNPKYRQIALLAAQGSMDWEPPSNLPDWFKDIAPPGSWLLRCDQCGMRLLWSPPEKAEINAAHFMD
jgi:hypothetical protein